MPTVMVTDSIQIKTGQDLTIIIIIWIKLKRIEFAPIILEENMILSNREKLHPKYKSPKAHTETTQVFFLRFYFVTRINYCLTQC